MDDREGGNKYRRKCGRDERRKGGKLKQQRRYNKQAEKQNEEWRGKKGKDMRRMHQRNVDKEKRRNRGKLEDERRMKECRNKSHKTRQRKE